MQNRYRNRFISGFSGLRAIAVIGVILYHLNPNLFVGGYLGVPIFFVLSGYLVTDHILTSLEQTGKYDLKKYYLGRLKKLYPQLITVLWAASAYIAIFQRNLLDKLYQIVLANLLNVYNWWQIFNGQSYFERFAANESPFTHLWTMSLQGQFYFIWPLIVILLATKIKRKRTQVWLILAVTILSALEMALMFKPGVDTSRIYYGTDTRFYSLGLGALLAYLWPIRRLKEKIEKQDALFLDAVGVLALGGMLFLFFSPSMNPVLPFAYHFGMFLFSVLVAILCAVIAHPGSHFNDFMTNRFFNYLGSRSYAIYLYQFPVMIFLEDKVQDFADHVLLYRVSEVVLILILAEVTYRLIEKPFGKITMDKFKDLLLRLKSRGSVMLKVGTVVLLVIFSSGCVGIFQSPGVKSKDPNQTELAKKIKANRKLQEKERRASLKKIKQSKGTSKSMQAAVEAAKKAAKRHPVNQDFEKYHINQVELQLAQQVSVTAVGDSVMAGASDVLKQLMPNSLVDAKVSRQVRDGVAILQSYASQGALAKNIVIGLGTNGQFTLQDLAQVMQLAGKKRQVFWINVRVPNRSWQNPVNNLLRNAQKQYRNLHVIDWYGESNSHANWFYADKTHPTPDGDKWYSAFVVKKIVSQAQY